MTAKRGAAGPTQFLQRISVYVCLGRLTDIDHIRRDTPAGEMHVFKGFPKAEASALQIFGTNMYILIPFT